MTGVSSDLLAPDAVFTWAQAVQSTYALEGCPTLSSSVKFADAAPADWFASAVNCAAANGVVSEWIMPIWLPTARSFVLALRCPHNKGYDTRPARIYPVAPRPPLFAMDRCQSSDQWHQHHFLDACQFHHQRPDARDPDALL